jgi:hypothetical protein
VLMSLDARQLDSVKRQRGTRTEIDVRYSPFDAGC